MSFQPRIVDNRLDLNDELERSWAERGQVSGDAFQARATRQSPSQSSLSRLFERVSAIAWRDVLFGAACGLLAGMLGTVGLAYIWALFL